MPAPMVTRLLNCLQFHESFEEGSCEIIWYRWLQLIVGTAGFFGFVSYAYISPLNDLPITLVCFFISGVALISAVLAFIKLLTAYRIKRRNNASTSCSIELTSEQNAGDPAENDSADSTTTLDEVENLRQMLKLTLSSHNKQHKTEGQNKRPFPYEQHHAACRPSDANQNWVNSQRNVCQFPSRNKLQRTESYESSLRFLQSYRSSGYASTWNGSFGSSSSGLNTYIYTSSSEGGKSSVYGWRRNLGWIPRAEPPTTKPNLEIISHINRDIELFKMERDQYTKRLPKNFPERFPALPFPKRNNEIQESKRPHPEGQKQFKSLTKEESTVTRSRSVVNIDECERMSRKDVLKVLASLSPNIPAVGRPEPKSSRKKHGRKNSVPKNTNIKRV